VCSFFLFSSHKMSNQNQVSSPLRFLCLALDGIILVRCIYKLMEFRWRYKYNIRQEPPKKQIRVWVDGVFDMMHFGHANMLRQAKALGDYLIVGVNSSETVIEQKGTPPVMTDQERVTAVEAVKWVDEVVPDVPYVMSAEYIEMITEKYKIDLFVHGDDPCLDAQGNDVYAHVKAQGKFQTVKRTEGVSSTELVGRMLLLTRDHHQFDMNQPIPVSETNERPSIQTFQQHTRISPFLPTTRRFMQFSSGKTPKSTDKVVYIVGSWDMCHPGHIAILKAAKKYGDFLLVGICDDATVNLHKGSNWPIMNLHERTLCVLAIRYVDEVIIGAPWNVTEDLIKTMNISTVVNGTVHGSPPHPEFGDPFEIAKKKGIYIEIPSPSVLTTEEIVERIIHNRSSFEKRYSSKAKKEEVYYQERKFVEEK
jgi:ethanolamine-phosphate cytidylyltransferase